MAQWSTSEVPGPKVSIPGLGGTRLIIDSDRNSGGNTSSRDDVQSRFLLVAASGAWVGFLGLMAMVTTDEAFLRPVGAIALILGLVTTFVGLVEVVRHQSLPLDNQWTSSDGDRNFGR